MPTRQRRIHRPEESAEHDSAILPLRKTFGEPADVLFVDLDDTLISTDLLWESAILGVKRDPRLLWRIPFWALGGRASLKRHLAERVIIDAARLPYREDIVKFLKAEAEYRPVVLATASDEVWAREVAEEVGCFEDVLASNGRVNLKGAAKLTAIREYCAEHGHTKFAYIGDSRSDLPIWAESSEPYVVEPGSGLLKAAANLPVALNVFGERPSRLKALVKALRPQQWVKNLLLFLPLIMAHELYAVDKIIATCLAFVAFCLCASSVYVLNDLSDARSDRHHPHKKHRPFASGALPVSWGPLISAVLLTAGFTLASLTLPKPFIVALICYQVLTTLYTFWLKQQVLVDVQMLAGLYTLRILAGGYASQVPVSEWMMGFSVFLFTSLAFAKRYAELARMKDSGGRRRPTGRGYHVADLGLIEVLGPTSGYLAVVVLAMYIHSPTVSALYARPWALWLICPVILYWVSRIWLLARRRQLAEDPVVFAIRDRVSLALGAAVALLLFFAAAPWA